VPSGPVSHAETYHLLGMASLRSGRLSDALRAYQKAKALNPSLSSIDADIKDARARMKRS